MQTKPNAFSGNGRIYQVVFTAGNGTQSCRGLVNVVVPALLGRQAVEDKKSYESTGQ